MEIKSISFENYKAFLNQQTLKLKPITILIGKNSSGKSSIAKLFPLLGNSLSGSIGEPVLLKNKGVELGAEFIDLAYNRQPIVPVKFSIELENGTTVSVAVLQELGKYDVTLIEWAITSPNFNISLSYSPDKGYVDAEGKRYSCHFMGFVPIYIINLEGVDLAPNINLDWTLTVDYIGPFRILPERVFYLTGQVNYDNIGIRGENAYAILGVSKLKKDGLHEKTGRWYKDHFDGWELLVEDKNKPYIEIKLEKGSTNINIVDVGQGMNQALPLVVRANIFKENSLIIVEQPELHLHPAAHGDLAELFAASAKQAKQKFLIETHSENILLRLRKLVVENSFGFTPDDIVIYWVSDAEDGGQEITEITIDEEGTLSAWPEGVFTENVNEIIEMRKAVKRKKAKNQ